MLTPNDIAKVTKLMANDLQKNNMQHILTTMSEDSKADFVNGVRCMTEVVQEIEKENYSQPGLVFMTAGE